MQLSKASGRPAVVGTVLAALSFFVAACGGGPAHDGVASLGKATMVANALRYTKCMRSHGEPDFPYPDAQGEIKITNPTGIMDQFSPKFQRAENACRSVSSGFDVLISTEGPGGPS